MEKIAVHDTTTGEVVHIYPHAEFMAECAEYLYDRTFKHFLSLQRQRGASAQDAIAALRERLGAKTKLEKAEIWQAKLEGWRQAREAKERKPAGRPRVALGLGEVKATIAAALFQTIAKLERKAMTDDSRTLLDGMRKQLASW